MTVDKSKARRWLLPAAVALFVVVLVFVLFAPVSVASWLGSRGAPTPLARANFFDQAASEQVHKVADQIVVSADHEKRPFLLVDKVNARLYVFNSDGSLRANAPVLLGAAPGDDSAPGIGLRPIADIKPFERTTPAGKFLSEAGHNAKGEDIVWVDYDAAISMHRVRATNPAEHRLERLATPTVDDNRISYGCINVPAAFFDEYVAPIFQTAKSNVYVLPEVKADSEVFHWPVAAGTSIAAR